VVDVARLLRYRRGRPEPRVFALPRFEQTPGNPVSAVGNDIADIIFSWLATTGQGSYPPGILILIFSLPQAPGRRRPEPAQPLAADFLQTGQHLEVRRRERGTDASSLAGPSAWTDAGNGGTDVARR